MARRFTKPIDLYHAQMADFAKANLSAREGHRKLAEHGRADLMELVSGTPSGKERIKLLRRLGHPFGRVGSAPRGAMRGASAALRRKHGLKGNLPFLPIGQISFRLRRSIDMNRVASPGALQAFALRSRGVPYAKYILSPVGTRKMVARGVEREIRRRWRARNRAFYDWFVKQQRT